ncbi:winged helix-turn-helix transcriptional regulator [Sporolactobacillus shoreicorticis]|uniref:Winged helix-turn-helix transcriptional regulator n=1 Tax=Sporolactobacillus shoreicorticis TaxID=1923877 RepID=A0ABW5RZG6_9BACL|nr:winged helix-turn-helix transcriptional regulator [Sporolactobacillus shoreicorticis]MCO7127585.1 winged helix-turn-helix transcriptional regulator [Sporolactobacillus shoreicorticis]
MESGGIIARHTYHTVPPTVTYSLTTEGRQLIALFESLRDWGEKNIKKRQATGESVRLAEHHCGYQC